MLAFHLLLVRHKDVVGLRVDDITTIDDLLAALYKSCSQWDTVMELVEARLTALFIVFEVGCQIVVEITLLQDVLVLGQRLVEEDLFVSGDNRVDVIDGHTAGVLAVDNADKACGILMQVVILGAVHNTCGVEVSQTVGDNAQVVITEAGDAVGVVFIELPYLITRYILVNDVIGFVELHETVALFADDLIALVNGEVEGCAEVGVDPRASFLNVETEFVGAWHKPDDDGNGAYDECGTDEKIAPREVVLKIETTHLI